MKEIKSENLGTSSGSQDHRNINNHIMEEAY